MTRFQIAKRQRDDEIMRLLRTGLKHWQIAEKMGFTRTWVSLVVGKARKAGLL